MPRRQHQRADAARSAPPHFDWRLMGFTDSVTDAKLGIADVRQRLQSRRQK